MNVPLQIGYCTNVHAGKNLAEYWDQLRKYSLAVKQNYSPNHPMGIGLWFSARAAEELLTGGELNDFRAWLAEAGLVPFTFNGFPYGDFHESVVKHRVYLPTWMEPARVDYTLQLAQLQHLLLPSGEEGSISTLPIAWGSPQLSEAQFSEAAKNLVKVAVALDELAKNHGRIIRLAIEPEPGCVFSFTQDLVDFYEQHLCRGLSESQEQLVRTHIQVCHDICHSAVMFEDQADVLERYHRVGIQIAKFQVSSAVRMNLEELPACGTERDSAIAQLREFNEPKYLHQTMVQRGADAPRFYEDLNLALEAEADENVPDRLFGQWRVHFHVPIFLERFGRLQSTQDEIEKCLLAAKRWTNCRHWEVETYAWGVLPAELRQMPLSDGIARELAWLTERVPQSEF